jgi:hypothetical protein
VVQCFRTELSEVRSFKGNAIVCQYAALSSDRSGCCDVVPGDHTYHDACALALRNCLCYIVPQWILDAYYSVQCEPMLDSLRLLGNSVVFWAVHKLACYCALLASCNCRRQLVTTALHTYRACAAVKSGTAKQFKAAEQCSAYMVVVVAALLAIVLQEELRNLKDQASVYANVVYDTGDIHAVINASAACLTLTHYSSEISHVSPAQCQQ